MTLAIDETVYVGLTTTEENSGEEMNALLSIDHDGETLFVALMDDVTAEKPADSPRQLGIERRLDGALVVHLFGKNREAPLTIVLDADGNVIKE